MFSILVEAIDKLKDKRQGWLDTVAECEEFGDTTGAGFSRGVATGIDESIKTLEKLFDEELNKYAAGK